MASYESESHPERRFAYDEGKTSSALPDARTVEGAALRRSFAGRGPRNYRRSDQRIFQSVCQALEDHPELDATDIEVSAQQGEITLRGSVPDARSAQLAEICARAAPGVLHVRNELAASAARAEAGDRNIVQLRNHVQEASEESFPASDAPAWTATARTGAPRRTR